jgi:hypothetical protein
VAEDLHLLWTRSGPLSDPETRAELIDLLAEKNASLMGRAQKDDLERAIHSRISIADVKDRIIYPEELRYQADVYSGSAGSKVELADRKIPAGKLPFTYQFRYRKFPQVSENVC